MSALNFHYLRYFWAVAHAGNLTRAAQELHVSQSAVSVQIRKLEEELGHDLFERRGRGLVLTEAGRIALDHADAIFSIGAELERTLRDSGAQRRLLRIGAIATLSRNFQVGFLRPVLHRSDIELVMRSGTLRALLDHLEAHQLDVVLSNVLPDEDPSSPWVSRPLARQAISLVAHPEDLRGNRDVETILRSEPIVLPTTESSVRTAFETRMKRLGIEPQIAAEVDDMAMLRLVARERNAFAVLPSIVVKDELASGVLVEVGRIPGLEETFYAITSRRRFANPLLDALLDRSPL